MSRAGKFIPGGSNKAKRTGPIRAPDANAPAGGGGGAAPGGDGGQKKLIGGLRKPISKSQKWPIYVMSAVCVCLLLFAGGYFVVYLPDQRKIADYKKQLEEEQAREKADADARAKAAAAALAAAAAAKGVVTVDSAPSGAKVTVGDFSHTTPARLENLVAGTYDVTIQMDGYEDYKSKITLTPDAPVDLGVITLVQKTGDVAITLPGQENDVTYTLTGSNDYKHQGKLPDKIESLPIGDYVLNAAQNDWQHAPIRFSVADHDQKTVQVKFPYAHVALTSTPSGATVRDGRTVLGVTPLTLPPQRPRDLRLTLDLPPYTIQHIDLHLSENGNANQSVKLAQDKDFIAACGMPMVWIPDGGYWAAKYPFRQSDFEKVAGYNPSNFRGANLPVETISWESAQAFVGKLNDYEKKADKLPAGFHYALPKETQWDQMNADADITQAALSSNGQLTSTQNVGYSAPNKYGLYDTLGNVWEWCLDDFDEKGNHTLRGGTWLSLPENFPNASARQGGPPKYADKFIGFRVVLTPNA